MGIGYGGFAKLFFVDVGGHCAFILLALARVPFTAAWDTRFTDAPAFVFVLLPYVVFMFGVVS